MEYMNNSLFSTERNIIDLNAVDMMAIESFTQLQKVAEIDEKNKIVKTTLMDLDTISRNGSLYDRNDFITALQSPLITELIRNGLFFGELQHPPMDCSKERFLTIDHDNICHRINNYDVIGNRIKGEVQFFKPKGDNVWEWILGGASPAWSVRVLTPNYKAETTEDGREYVKKYGFMKLVTFDCVFLPGFESARMVDTANYNCASEKAFEGISYQWTAERKKEEIFNLLKAQETLPMMQEIYGFELKPGDVLSYSKEGYITVQLNKNTKSIKIPTNVMNVNRVLGSTESYIPMKDR